MDIDKIVIKYFKVCTPLIAKSSRLNLPFKLKDEISISELNICNKYFVGYFLREELICIEKFENNKIVFKDEYFYGYNKKFIGRRVLTHFDMDPSVTTYYYNEKGEIINEIY